jgi:hypothetical protein
MSDVVVAAAIAGAVGVLGNGLTYLATRKQAEVTIQNVERQASIDLARVEAENTRLRQQHLEAERQNRQGTYHRLLALLDRFDMYGTGYAPTDDEFTASLDALNTLVGGVHLMAPTSVRAAMDKVSKYFFGVALTEAPVDGVPKVERFVRGYRDARTDFLDAEGRLIEAMRKDVGVVADLDDAGGHSRSIAS